jgi:flagellar motor switch protein FliG
MNPTTEQTDERLRRAAAVLSLIGPDEATAVCRRLDPVTAHRIIRAIASVGNVGRDERTELARTMVSRMRGDGNTSLLALRLMESVLGLRGGLGGLGAEETELSFEQLALLEKADPSLIWRAISDEMPQAIALIARHLSPSGVARLLSAMPEEIRGEVAYRMAASHPPSTGALRALARVTERLVKLSATGGDTGDSSTQFLAEVISQLSRNVAQGVLSSVKQQSEELGSTIEQMIFNFGDILRLPGPSLQTILRSTTTADLALALKGVTDDLKMVVFTNLSTRARSVLEEEMDLLGPVPASEAERAQREIVQLARSLDAAGEISLEPGEVEYVE